LIEISKKL